jgi:hypothetical protein
VQCLGSSGLGEEKKTDEVDEQKHDVPPYPSLTGSHTTSTSIKLKSLETKDSPLQAEEEEESVRASSGTFSRASPGTFSQGDATGDGTDDDELSQGDASDDGTEGDEPLVDDIAMSPIPFDHEDPKTLMELPENLLSLPISPCGPHDYSTGKP